MRLGIPATRVAIDQSGGIWFNNRYIFMFYPTHIHIYIHIYLYMYKPTFDVEFLGKQQRSQGIHLESVPLEE